MKLLRIPKSRRQLYLERLEERLMLNVTLGPGEWTYFDIAADSVAGDGDAIFAVDPSSTGYLSLIADSGGKKAPTRVVVGGGIVKFIFNGDVPILSGAPDVMIAHHTDILVDGNTVSAEGISASDYVDAGAAVAGSGNALALYDGAIGDVTLSGTVSGELVDHFDADMGNFNADNLADFSVVLVGDGQLGDVELAGSWDGGELRAGYMGTLTVGKNSHGNIYDLSVVMEGQGSDHLPAVGAVLVGGSWIGTQLDVSSLGTIGDIKIGEDFDVAVTGMAPNFDIGQDVGEYFSYPLELYDTLQSFKTGGDMWSRASVYGHDIQTVLIRGKIGRDQNIDAKLGEFITYFNIVTGGGNISSIEAWGGMEGDIIADVSVTNAGHIGEIYVGYRPNGLQNEGVQVGTSWAESIIVADVIDSMTIEGDVTPGINLVGNPFNTRDLVQRFPMVTNLMITGTAYNLWVQGGPTTAQVQDAGYLTLGGFRPFDGTPRLDVGTLQIGKIISASPGSVVHQLSLWGNVETIDINNVLGGDLGNGSVYVDGEVHGHLAIEGSSHSITVGQLTTGASLTVGRFLGDPDGENIYDDYIYFMGARPSAYSPRYWSDLDETNLIAVGNNEFRLFSEASLLTADVQSGDFFLTDDSGRDAWNPDTRDFWNPHPQLADPRHADGEEMFNRVPDANPGTVFVDGADQYDYRGWGFLSYDDGTYGNYYYRGFRILDAQDTRRTLGGAVFSQEFITIKDSFAGAYRQYPDVTMAVTQGRITQLDIVSNGHAGLVPDEATGVESSIAVQTTVNVYGNLSFVFAHGDDAYRGNILGVDVTRNEAGYGDLSGARMGDYWTITDGSDPIATDTRHLTVYDHPYSVEYLNGLLNLNGIVGVYARNGSIGTVHVEGSVAGDIVADYNGIDLVEIEAIGTRHGNGYGLYGTILARSDTGNISRVRATTSYAFVSANTDSSMGARIIAGGRIGVADDRSAWAGDAWDANSDWAIWIGPEIGDLAGNNGTGYVDVIRGQAGSSRTRIHADSNDVWNIDLIGQAGFGPEDRIDLPYDNDLYLQVEGPHSWDLNDRNDFSRDGNGYPTVNHVLIGEKRGGAIDNGVGWYADRNISHPDVGVARRFTAFAHYSTNVYLFNEGNTGDPLSPTYDGDVDRVEFVQYEPVGADATIDEYLYHGYIDRIEFISGGIGPNQGIATLITTKLYVPDSAGPGFNFYGRVLASGANALLVAAEGEIREVRGLNGNNLVGAAFGLEGQGLAVDPADGKEKVMGLLSLSDPSLFEDWDGDGQTVDPTAVISFRGYVKLVSTNGAVSVLGGDVVTVADQPILGIDANVNDGSVIDVVAGGDIVSVNIRGEGGTINVLAPNGTVGFIQTTGNIARIVGSTQGVNTFINATEQIERVEITQGVWQSGDRLISGGSDVFMTSTDGFTDGMVTLLGIPTSEGNTPETAALSFWLYEESSDDFDMWVYAPDGTLTRYYDRDNYLSDTTTFAGPDVAYFANPLPGEWTIKVECWGNNNPTLEKHVRLETQQFGEVVQVLADFTVPANVADHAFVQTATYAFNPGAVGQTASTQVLANYENVGDGRYYYVTQGYTSANKSTTIAPFAQVDLNSEGMDDQVHVTFTTNNGVLSTIAFKDDLPGRPEGVGRVLTIYSTDPLNAVAIDSIAAGNVNALYLDEVDAKNADLYLSAQDYASYGWDPDARTLTTKIVPPATVTTPNHSTILLDNSTVFSGPTSFNHFFFTQGNPLPFGDVEFTTASPVVGSALMVATIDVNPQTGLRYPAEMDFQNVGDPFLVLSLNAVNTDLGNLSFGGDVDTIIVQDGQGNVGSVEIVGHLHEIDVGTVGGVFTVTGGVDIVNLTSVDSDLTIGGNIIFNGAMIYGDIILLAGVTSLQNPGGTFFGNIMTEPGLVFAVDLISAGSFQGGTITIHGDLGALIAEDDLNASVSVQGGSTFSLGTLDGNIVLVMAGGNIDFGAAGLNVTGSIGDTSAAGTLTNPGPEGIDGRLYTGDDEVNGIIAGGNIVGPITAGGRITAIMSGGNLGAANDWVTPDPGALNRTLVSAAGNVGVVDVGGDLYGRISVLPGVDADDNPIPGTLDFLMVEGDVYSASSNGFFPGAGFATNTIGGLPIISASSIGLMGVRGTTFGATTTRLLSGHFFDWTDEAAVAHQLGVTGGTAMVDLAFGNVVRISISSPNATVSSTGDLGIVTNSGSLSVITGTVRKHELKVDKLTGAVTDVTTNAWVGPVIRTSGVYGLTTDKVYTTGVTAGVMGVESFRGNINRVASTGPVGSVVADLGSIKELMVVDNSLGLTVGGMDVSLAGMDHDQSVYAAKNIGYVRVMSSTATLDEFSLATPKGGVRSDLPWMLGSVACGGVLGEVSVQRLGQGSQIIGGRGVKDVQIVLSGGWILDFSRIEAIRGNIGNVMIGAAVGTNVVVRSDSSIEIVADAGRIGTVTATGDMIGTVGGEGTTGIGTIRSLSGSIGRSDSLNPDNGFITLIATHGKVSRISALGDVFAEIDAGSIGTIMSETGDVGGPGATIRADGAISRISANTGIGADSIWAGGNVGTINVFGGSLNSDITIGGKLSNLMISGAAANATQGTIIVGNGIGKINLSGGALGGTMTVNHGSVGTLVVNNAGGNAVTGTLNVINGNLRNIQLNGDMRGTLNVGGSITTFNSIGRLMGDINVLGGGIGTLTNTGNVQDASIQALNGAIRNVTIHGSYTDSDLIARSFRSIRVDGTIRDLDPDPNVINALNPASSFKIADSTGSAVISAAANHQDFGGVDVFVG